MSSTFNDAPFRYKVNSVALLYGCEPVSNRDGGTILCSGIESILNYSFAVTIESGGGFVKQQYGRVSDQSTSDCDTFYRGSVLTTVNLKDTHAFVRR